MNIIEQGKRFVQSLRQLAGRSVWQWRRCPHCGSTHTCKNGSYTRHPWFFEGRGDVRVQRHLCHDCGRTYSERSALLVRGSWYARDVHRWAIDHWPHAGSSLRRTAEWLRTWMGWQERWRLWRPLEAVAEERSSAVGWGIDIRAVGYRRVVSTTLAWSKAGSFGAGGQ